MSGIAGIIRFDGAPVEPGLVQKMTAAMDYRGPDGINHWIKGSVALGQCMLRTTPESLEENQPLTNEDESLVLVMDGRVDNWEELRKELLGRGVVLRTRADAELVLRAYESWGKECLAHIDGDFALVIWDVKRQRAFCARDRMGNKPFNYHWDGKFFVFSSEVRPIVFLPWVKQVLNEGMVAEFLAAEWYSRNETFWQGVMRLVAAHSMEVGPEGPRLGQYWEPDLWTELPYKSDEEYIEQYRELFSDSVRRLSRSHQPVAYEVSGGLDSSAIFCMAEHLRQTSCLPAPGIKGYTLDFTGNERADELAYARAVGEYLGIHIHQVPPSIVPLAWYEERAHSFRDFPGFPNGTMSIDLMREASSKGSRVILNGMGGDEWLSGSRQYYAEELSTRQWANLLESMSADITAYGVKQTLTWLIRYGFFPLLPTTLQKSLYLVADVARGKKLQDLYWLSQGMREQVGKRRRLFGRLPNQGIRSVVRQERLNLLRNAYLDFAVEETDRLNALAGLEARRPLYAYHLVQYLFSVPERLLLRGDRSKYLHVRSLKGLMPQFVLDRKSKAEFSIVLRTHIDQMELVLTKEIPERRLDWLAPDGVSRLYQGYRQNARSGWPLWVLWGIYGCDCIPVE